MLGFLTEILAKYQISVGLEIITGTDYSIGKNFEKKKSTKLSKYWQNISSNVIFGQKKWSMGQCVAARKDSTKNYQFIGDFLKVFFFKFIHF